MRKETITFIWAMLAISGFAQKEVKLEKSIIYSATGFVTDARKVAANTTIITAEDIEKKNYKSVSDILESIPSVVITKNTFFGGATVDLRGQGNTIAKRNVQLLIDGVPANSLDTSHISTPINTIAVSSIERIEVIPGGGSVLYGSGTAGGVINIITKKNTGFRLGVGSDYYLSYGGYKTDINTGYSFQNFDINLLYNRIDSKGYRDQSKDITNYFQGNFRYRISDRQSIEYKYSMARLKDYFPGYLTKEQVDTNRRQAGDSVTRVETNKDEHTITYNAKLTDKIDFNLVSFYQDSKVKTGSKGKATSGIFSDKKAGVRPKLKLSYGDGSSIIFGVDYLDNNAKRWALMGPATVTTDFNKDTFGVFLMNNYKYSEFEFNQGIRYETSKYDISRNSTSRFSSKKIKRDKTMNNFAAELSGAYLYSDTGRVYTRLERGFTSPPPSLLSDTVPRGRYGSTYVLNDLKSETYNSIELGMSDYLLNTGINAAVFYTLTENEIYTYMKGVTSITNYNIDKTQRYGAELSLSHYFGKLTFTESYQYINSKIKKGVEKLYNKKGKRENGGDLSGKYLEGVPSHKFSFGADYQITPKFSVGGEVVYTGSSYINNTNKGGKEKSHIVANLRTRYAFENGLSIYAGINNIFNTKYYNDVDFNTRTNQYTYEPADKINCYAGFKYKF